MKSIEVWTEKYRPQTLEAFVTPDKEKLKALINSKDLPHLLLVSKIPGTGKTSLSKIIIGMLGADALVLNSSDDRKIETVREKVNKFACSMSSTPGVPRIVFMDEFDGMLGASQDALRNIMETYYSNCRFILTANNDHKIIDPIKSRCFRVDLKSPDRGDIIDRLKFIAKAENVSVESDEVFNKIVDFHYPSIRNCIKTLQMLAIGGSQIMLSKVKPELHVEEEIFNLLKTGGYTKARTIWLEKGMDADDLLLNLYRLGVRDKMLPMEAKRKLVLEAAKYNSRMGFGDPELQLAAFALELVDITGGKLQ